jgi:hypothetical protein
VLAGKGYGAMIYLDFSQFVLVYLHDKTAPENDLRLLRSPTLPSKVEAQRLAVSKGSNAG